MERAVILAEGNTIGSDAIELTYAPAPKASERYQAQKARFIANFERQCIQEYLKQCDGNITKAAEAAGKHRRAFWELMRKHRLTAPLPAGEPGATPESPLDRSVVC